MEVMFLPEADDDLNFWATTGNKMIIKKIAQLIDDIKISPYSGLGKPEQLKHHLSGSWFEGSTKNIVWCMKYTKTSSLYFLPKDIIKNILTTINRVEKNG